MKLEKPEEGDLILQMSISHSLMWVGPGERCIVDSNEGKMSGVKFSKRNKFMLPENPETLFDSMVYRCKDRRIGEQAASYARVWASDPDQRSHLHPGATYSELMNHPG